MSKCLPLDQHIDHDKISMLLKYITHF